MISLPNTVTIIEVGPRDGLQNEKNYVKTEHKLAYIRALQAAGITEMEVTSFVSPKWVPQMADANEIMARIDRLGKQFVLTPNERGMENAKTMGADHIAVFVGVSSTFNQKNINKTTAEAVEQLRAPIAELLNHNIFVRACISTAFYCPYEGKQGIDDVISLCREFVEMGVHELSVADTVGKASPLESYTLFSLLKKEFPDTLITAHFHDTEKMALANIFAALQAGVDRFDSSAGGLGGCPFAPGATGNVATERVVHMLHRMGIATGIDEDLLKEAVAVISPHVSIH
ncbi:hydroxymethylglutaryl-CoA lyase [Chryseomicrobium sp. FSL W7-1435]|uniref:hydroxymethylglutaryl-CoA lyase n=1 Tax=Chryseomicrobium sp. FSL W7-1435 TaxID=2921704 RepID=UPI00315AE993